MGPPGAGKGTQAELLAQELGYHQFSTGAGFRKVAAQDTELGRKVKATIDAGILAPPEMAGEIVIKAIEEHMEAGRGLIFDGTPRTVAEGKIVDDFFVSHKYGKPLVIYVNVDKEEMMERNSKRKYCLGVADDFPVVDEAGEARCAEMGGQVGTRPDDGATEMETRWKEFMNQTWPVIQGYQGQDMVNEVDGLGTVEEVQAAIMEIVNKYDKT